MKLDPRTVRDLALAFHPEAYLRIIPAAHMATPLGMGFGQSRFSSANRLFTLLYAACDLPTAIAETIVRDRFEGTQERMLDGSEIEDWAVTEVMATEPLILLDLRTTGLLKLGVSTDAARAKAHREGQELSDMIYGSYRVDGLLYSSRLTAADCIAVYDRAVGIKLVASPAVALVPASRPYSGVAVHRRIGPGGEAASMTAASTHALSRSTHRPCETVPVLQRRMFHWLQVESHGVRNGSVSRKLEPFADVIGF